MQACMESHVLLQGGDVDLLVALSQAREGVVGAGASGGDSVFAFAGGATGKQTSVEKVRGRAYGRERAFWEGLQAQRDQEAAQEAGAERVEKEGKGKGKSGGNGGGKGQPSTSPGLNPRFLEVHLGCSVGRIAAACPAGHALPRGVLQLVIYPRNNNLHAMFLQQHRNRIIALLP
mmetsp:Transcript_12594/g.27967  ORF Transcript_12594/g.27967 Transcript_12594/m.27967 type:complete len:175 (+) Transcript_12594:249-773(+)